MKRPYYLNDCDCGKTHSCLICRSKYNRAIRLEYTAEDKRQLRECAKFRRENMTDAENEIRRKKQRIYHLNLTDEQKAKKKITDRRSRLKQQAIRRQQRGING